MSKCPIKINDGQQGKHIPGHRNYAEGRSILRVDAETLLPFAGSGHPANAMPPGEPGYRERVHFGRIIGEDLDEDSHVGVPTTNGIIHYGKRGIYIVPCRP